MKMIADLVIINYERTDKGILVHPDGVMSPVLVPVRFIDPETTPAPSPKSSPKLDPGLLETSGPDLDKPSNGDKTGAPVDAALAYFGATERVPDKSPASVVHGEALRKEVIRLRKIMRIAGGGLQKLAEAMK